MTREEQIKKQALDSTIGIVDEYNGFIRGAKWADEHPNGNLIRWQTGEPKERGVYLVTYKHELPSCTTVLFYMSGAWLNGDWLECPKRNIVAWCKLSDIEPYKEEAK